MNRYYQVLKFKIDLINKGPKMIFYFLSLAEVPMLYPTLQHSTLDWEFLTMPSNQYCLAMGGVCQWPRGKVLYVRVFNFFFFFGKWQKNVIK